MDDLEATIADLRKKLDKATTFTMTERYNRPITIEARGKNTWAVCDGGFCLNTDGEFEEEPMPSSRDEEFLARARFSLEEAWALAEKVVKEGR